ncbi:MAG: hypothetical protein ACOC88_02615 [Candidatus Bipolaricaulota bacterium]
MKLNGEKLYLISVREISGRKEREERLTKFKRTVEGLSDLMAA